MKAQRESVAGDVQSTGAPSRNGSVIISAPTESAIRQSNRERRISDGWERQMSYVALHTNQRTSTASMASDRSPFPEDVVGFHSNHGCRPGNTPDTYQVKTNQDRAAVTFIPAEESLQGIGHQMVFQAYDGHGPGGEHVSEFAARKLLDVLRDDDAKLQRDPVDALRCGLMRVDELLTAEGVQCMICGCTAIVALLREKHVHVACLGDSRWCAQPARAPCAWRGRCTRVADARSRARPAVSSATPTRAAAGGPPRSPSTKSPRTSRSGAASSQRARRCATTLTPPAPPDFRCSQPPPPSV